jgi:hypothetical protein
MKSLIFIEHSIIARHFLHSKVFEEFTGEHETEFIFPQLTHRRIAEIDFGELELNGGCQHINVLPERQITWKWMFLVHQLTWRPGKQASVTRRRLRRIVRWKAACMLTFLGLPVIRLCFQWLARKKLRKHPFSDLSELLDRERPDILIHPCVMEGLFLNDLIVESKKRGIPLVVIMNSWDNPSTKRAMIGNPDWLLVWGEQTRRHAVELASMPAHRTLKFGAAQFEVYREPPRMSRDEFCELNGVNPALPLLVYAGSSKGTREIDHLRLLDAAVESGVLPPITILYRPHPWGNGGEGGENILDEPWHHVAIEHSMREYLKQVRAGNKQLCLSDYRQTHEVLCHCDALISPLSTIILEAALHGKPVLCCLPTGGFSYYFNLIQELKHFQEMFDMPEILISKGENELILMVKKLLNRAADSNWQERMIQAGSFFVEPHEQPFSCRFREFCEQVVAGEKVAS